MLIEPGSKLLMIGDSITDCGRDRPVGLAFQEGLGNGYVSLVNALLTATYPRHAIHVLNMGISGNTVLDLAARWKSDVLDHQPDWLSIMIGINDVWRQFDAPDHPEWHVPLETYARTLEGLVLQTRGLLKGLVLISPYFIEPNPEEPMRARMDQYGQAARSIAERNGAIFVDAQAAINRTLQVLHPSALAWDRVHPGQAGHAILARAFLSAVGYSW